MRYALLLLLLFCAPALADTLKLVESFPVETDFDQPDIDQAHLVWLRAIEGAQREILWHTFYVAHREGKRTGPILQALKEAAGRGVRVRLLVDEKFGKAYPETLDQLRAVRGIEVRFSPIGRWCGGVMHAKAIFVDGRWGFIGSQNFDWRSLEHIRELGLEFDSPELVKNYSQVFRWEWEHADGQRPPGELPKVDSTLVKIDEAVVYPTFSPQSLVPWTARDDETELVRLMDKAEKSIVVALLSYSPVTHDGKQFYGVLDNALRRASVRGVKVRLMVSHWEKEPALAHLRSLAQLKGVEVRICRIPEAAEGPIQFARVHHSKYLVVDGEMGWIGTANWARGYFHESRNYGMVIVGGAIPPRVQRLFDFDWERSEALKNHGAGRITGSEGTEHTHLAALEIVAILVEGDHRTG